MFMALLNTLAPKAPVIFAWVIMVEIHDWRSAKGARVLYRAAVGGVCKVLHVDLHGGGPNVVCVIAVHPEAGGLVGFADNDVGVVPVFAAGLTHVT